MKKRKIKKNIFLSLVFSAAKSAASCLLALLLLGILENISSDKKISSKKK